MCSTIVEQIFVIRSFLTHNQKILQTATFNSIYIVYVHKINVTFKSYSTTITTQNIIGYNPKQAVSNWHKVPLRNVFMQYVVCVVPQISIYTHLIDRSLWHHYRHRVVALAKCTAICAPKMKNIYMWLVDAGFKLQVMKIAESIIIIIVRTKQHTFGRTHSTSDKAHRTH